MANATQKMGRAGFGTTMKQGINMMRGKDVTNYTLIYEDQPQNIAQRESTIWAPSIVLGRANNAYVVYGDQYTTVSREHAQINIKDNGQIVIQQLSNTNPTLVNGQPISSAQPLNPGDNIQLSYEGPRLRFVATPANKTTASMKFTRRLQEFGSQALRPYKRAIAILSILLVSLAGFTIYSTLQSQEKIGNLETDNSKLRTKITSIEVDKEINEKKVSTLEDQLQNTKDYTNTEILNLKKQKSDLLNLIAQQEIDIQHFHRTIADNDGSAGGTDDRSSGGINDGSSSGTNDGSSGGTSKNGSNLFNSNKLDSQTAAAELSKHEDDIFFIYIERILVPSEDGTRVELEINLDVQNSISGTGFLTDKGVLVTARHVVMPWRFGINVNNSCEGLDQIQALYKRINEYERDGKAPTLSFRAISPKNQREFTFTLNQVDLTTAPDKLDKCGLHIVPQGAYKSDWAYVQTNMTGSIRLSKGIAEKLPKGSNLFGFGYSYGAFYQYKDEKKLDPFLLQGTVAQENTVNNLINISNLAIDHGSSGGPMFIKYNGKWEAVGIVSNGKRVVVSLVPVTQLNI